MKLRKQLTNDMSMNIGQAPVDAVVAYMSLTWVEERFPSRGCIPIGDLPPWVMSFANQLAGEDYMDYGPVLCFPECWACDLAPC